MPFRTSHACALLATGWLGCGPATAQHDPASATGIAPQPEIHLAQAGAFVSTRQGTQRRPEFKGLFPGMPASALPASLAKTYQPIPSAALLKLIAERYREAFVR
jgi:hypothetical protein